MNRARLCSWIIGLAAALPAAAMAEQAITTTAVNLRAGPDADYPLVRWVPEGTAVEVHGCLADYRWCDVEVYNDRGWMAASYLVYPYQNSAVPIGWLHVLFWAGLRGAVAVAMALSVPEDFPQRELLQQITFGIVLFTLVVQGASAGWVVARAGVRGTDERRDTPD